MAFNDSSSFGYRGGYDPGREFASPFGAARPEMFGLGTLDEAARQASQFPVMASGAGGPATQFSQVEVNGGPTQVGDTEASSPGDVASAVGRATRIADSEVGAPSSADLARLTAAAGGKLLSLGKDVGNLSFFSPGMNFDAAPGTPGDQVSGGELNLEGDGGGGGSTGIGTAASGADAAASILGLVGGLTRNPDLGAAGQGLTAALRAAGAIKNISSLRDLNSAVPAGEAITDAAVGAGAGAGAGAGGASAGGTLGGVAGGAGAVAAILGLIASLTHNDDLGTAATAVGAGATAAGAGAALAGAGGAISGPAAVVTAPIALTLAIDSLFSKKGEDIISDTMRAYQGDYPTWNQAKLLPAENSQRTALQTLQSALPYVQSKEELGQLLNSYKNYVTTTTGAPLTGGADGIYNLQTIPGTGPVSHGQQTPTIDWGNTTAQLQPLLDLLRTNLPGNEITASYGQPGGGLEGEAGTRLWSQFLDRPSIAKVQVTNGGAAWAPPEGVGEGGSGFSGATLPSAPPGFYAPGDLGQFSPNATVLRYGDPGYDYEGSGLPAPGQFMGSLSPYWQQLVAQAQAIPRNLPGLAQVAA